MSKSEPERPESVPEAAHWSSSDNEWVLPERDDEDRFHGTVSYWRPDGTLVNECEYQHGAPHGRYRRFHENGEVSREGTFVEGQLHGTDVFHRCDDSTTENFPHGLPDMVWRAEMDMCKGRVVAGRLFDKEGRRISEDGKPYPDRPAEVPETASFSSKTRRWLAGAADESFERDGLWCWWNEEGELVREVLYRSGEELESREFATPFEARIALALREGRLEEAVEIGRERLKTDPEHCAIGYWLLDALGSLAQRERGEARDALHAEQVAVARKIIRFTDGKEKLQGVFTASGRRFFETRQKALDRVARDMLASESSTTKLAQALALAEQAVECDHHYGNDYVRVTKAEILLALGRREEAFQIVRALSARNPDLEGIAAIRERKAYERWLEEVDTGALDAEDARRILGSGGDLLAVLGQPIAEKRDEREPIAEGEDLRLMLGDRIPLEIGAWISVVEEFELQGTYRGELMAPLAVGLGDAIDERDGKWLARFRSIFLPASAILLEDEEAYLVAWHPTTAGDCRVYYNHQDEWELHRWAPSIASFLTDRMINDTGFEEKLKLPARIKEEWARANENLREADTEEFPRWLDVEQLQARTDWLVDLFLEVGEGPKSSLARASNLGLWEEEKPDTEHWPHLAAYWLLSHMVFDNKEELEGLVAATEAHRDPAVVEIRALARAFLEEEEIEAEYWSESRVRGFRQTAFDAGYWLFSAESRERLEAASAAEGQADDAVSTTLGELRAADDERTRKALQYYNLLESASEDEAGFQAAVIQQWSEGDMDQVMEGTMKIRRGDFPALAPIIETFADLVDERWLPLLRAKIEIGAAYDEDHARSVPGMLAGLGFCLGSYEQFAEEVETLPFITEERYGRRRRMEHAIVAGHYRTEAEGATEFLRFESGRWAEQIDEWQRDTASNAFATLFSKRDEVALELGNRILETAGFSGANWNTCIYLAVQAGEAVITEMESGLRRAVEGELGRSDDGDRGRVVRAYARVAGESGIALLEELFRAQEEKWQAESRTDAWLYGYYHDDLCAVLGALIVLQPDRDEWVSKAREIVERYSKDDLSQARLGALHGLLTGLAETRIQGFGEDLDRLRHRIEDFDDDDMPKGFAKFLDEMREKLG